MLNYKEVVSLSLYINKKNVEQYVSDINQQILNASNKGKFETDLYFGDEYKIASNIVVKYYRSRGYIAYCDKYGRVYVSWYYTGLTRLFYKMLGY